MFIFDTVLIVILAGFIFYGFFFGLIRTVGMLAGLLVGAWLATQYYLSVFSWVDQWWPGNPSIGKVVVFIICFTVISRLVGWLFILFEQAFKVVTIVPFVKTINRLLGAVFGFVEGALVLGLFLYIASRYLPAGQLLAQWVEGSRVASFLISFSKILAPILPEIYKKIQTIL